MLPHLVSWSSYGCRRKRSSNPVDPERKTLRPESVKFLCDVEPEAVPVEEEVVQSAATRRREEKRKMKASKKAAMRNQDLNDIGRTDSKAPTKVEPTEVDQSKASPAEMDVGDDMDEEITIVVTGDASKDVENSGSSRRLSHVEDSLPCNVCSQVSSGRPIFLLFFPSQHSSGHIAQKKMSVACSLQKSGYCEDRVRRSLPMCEEGNRVDVT